MYDIEIANCKVIAHTANAIAKVITTQYDIWGNEKFIFREADDIESTDNALTLVQQIVTVNVNAL